MANTTGKKFGGRVKGTPNKRSAYAKDIIDRMGYCPLEALVHWAKGNWKELGYASPTVTRYTADGKEYYEDRISPELRQKAAKDILPYVYPALKATEHSIKPEAVKSIEEFIKENNHGPTT